MTQMPGSIVTLKNVQEKDREVWLDLTPAHIMSLLQNGEKWIECNRWMGGTFYGFIIETSNIVLVEVYR